MTPTVGLITHGHHSGWETWIKSSIMACVVASQYRYTFIDKLGMTGHFITLMQTQYCHKAVLLIDLQHNVLILPLYTKGISILVQLFYISLDKSIVILANHR